MHYAFPKTGCVLNRSILKCCNYNIDGVLILPVALKFQGSKRDRLSSKTNMKIELLIQIIATRLKFRCEVMLLYLNIGIMVRLLRSLTLIRILLLMAGVEQNPGPVDEYIFHYQYLLIEVGTDVMRKVFDVRVGYNFGKYLAANIKERRKLQSLILAKIITTDQTQHLPPIDNNPKSINFDITLLACLLRNVCGLRGHTDLVWKTPNPKDCSLEADLARLKACRNNLQHSGTVLISETVLKAKWIELSQIFTRLNNIAGIPNLPTLINDVKKMHIDVKLKKDYDDAIKAWTDTDKLIDRGIEELKCGQSDIIQSQAEIKDVQFDIFQGQSELKHNQSETIQGQSEIIQSQAEIKDGQFDIVKGQSELKQSQSEIIQGQSEIKDGHSKIVHCQSEIKHDQSEIIHGQLEIKEQQKEILQEISNNQQITKRHIEHIEQTHHACTPKQLDMDESELRNHLMKIYKEDCCSLPVTPLCVEDEDEIELLTIYQRPDMCRVPYHRSQQEEEDCKISSYKELLMKEEGRCLRNIYITGEAGVGKTSFCKCMAFLWSKRGESIGNDELQKDVDLMMRFDFLFYISLSKTVNEDVIDMIIDQLFYTKSKDKREEIVKLIEHVLEHKICLIILDGLDEWSPHISETKLCVLPRLFTSEMCSYITTCRPYKIENVRLSQKDLDIQVQITGISECSTECLVKEIVNHINHKTNEYKNPETFMRNIRRLELQEQLRIPLIAAHLVEVWFDHNLTDMSRTRLYCHIVNMLFKKAEKRQVQFPPIVLCTVQVPDILTSLFYVNKYFSLLRKVCLVSFRSLFKQDRNALALVFTEEQLLSEPYCLSSEEMHVLCKIGIISKHKVIGGFGKREQKVSFLHQSYLEFFAALFVSSFDLNDAFAKVVKTWTSINDAVQYNQFFRYLAGLSWQTTKLSLDVLYNAISDDLTLCRTNAIFHDDGVSYCKQIQSLQTMVIDCFKESGRSNDPNTSCVLEDIFFDKDSPDIDLLKQLLFLNRICVKSLWSVYGEYFDHEFGSIRKLQCLHVENASSVQCAKFFQLMLNNKSTIHTVSIHCRSDTLMPTLPVKSLFHLTSLSLVYITMEHDSLRKLMTALSRKVLIENIVLGPVYCYDHQLDYSECTMAINLRKHYKLTSLCMALVNIACTKVNISSIKCICLQPICEEIVSCYSDFFNCIRYSQLECVVVVGRDNWLDSDTTKTFINAMKTLPCIKLLKLVCMNIPGDVVVQLHPGVQQVDIDFKDVTMSCKCFRSFIKHLSDKNCLIKLRSEFCNIRSVESHITLGLKESYEYMYNYLTLENRVHIIKYQWGFYLETTGSQ